MVAYLWAANPSTILALIAQRAELLEALRGFNVGGDQIVSLTDGFVTIRLPRPVVEVAAQAIARATQSTVSQDAEKSHD